MLKVVSQVRIGLRNNGKYPVNKKLKQIRVMFVKFEENVPFNANFNTHSNHFVKM